MFQTAEWRYCIRYSLYYSGVLIMPNQYLVQVLVVGIGKERGTKIAFA